jgi:hypothetical protein
MQTIAFDRKLAFDEEEVCRVYNPRLAMNIHRALWSHRQTRLEGLSKSNASLARCIPILILARRILNRNCPMCASLAVIHRKIAAATLLHNSIAPFHNSLSFDRHKPTARCASTAGTLSVLANLVSLRIANKVKAKYRVAVDSSTVNSAVVTQQTPPDLKTCVARNRNAERQFHQNSV